MILGSCVDMVSAIPFVCILRQSMPEFRVEEHHLTVDDAWKAAASCLPTAYVVFGLLRDEWRDGNENSQGRGVASQSR